MWFLRIYWWPATIPWSIILRIRHLLYDHGILKSHRLSVPTIVIGNLSFGGTGKTPHVELVLESLKGLQPLATLSRGYGRSGIDMREVDGTDDASAVGDEPLMLKRTHPEVRVFVGADRVKAIEEMQRIVPDMKVVVLDDAFQHRRLKAGLSILLTSWRKPWYVDALVPAGTLRDLRSRARAAQVVVVTKSPELPGAEEQKGWRKRLRLSPEQELFFSGIEHGAPEYVHVGSGDVPVGQRSAALLVTGIADPTPLLMYAHATWGRVEHIAFTDHHAFDPADIDRLAGVFATFADPPKTLITTAKDAVRLLPMITGSALATVPIAVVPVKARILNEPDRFDALVRQSVAAHPAHG